MKGLVLSAISMHTGSSSHHSTAPERCSSFFFTRLASSLPSEGQSQAQRTECSLEFSGRTIVDFNVLVHDGLLLPDAAAAPQKHSKA